MDNPGGVSEKTEDIPALVSLYPAGAGNGHISLESVMTKLDLDGAVFNRTN